MCLETTYPRDMSYGFDMRNCPLIKTALGGSIGGASASSAGCRGFSIMRELFAEI